MALTKKKILLKTSSKGHSNVGTVDRKKSHKMKSFNKKKVYYDEVKKKHVMGIFKNKYKHIEFHVFLSDDDDHHHHLIISSVMCL